jgi:DNA-binding response OmpR family regulator
MYKVLVLEDDELFSATLEDFLDDEGFEVDIANDGEECLDLNYSKNYDLYIFDINVPKINGLDLLSQLRSSKDLTPTIFLTSYKDKDTLHQGFKNGCDDYIKKPVDLDELLFRIKALLKRNNKRFEPIKINDEFSFDSQGKRLFKENKDVKLPLKVAELLQLFLEEKNNVVTKEMIASRLWSVDEEYSEGSIRVYVNNLKKVLGKDFIINLKGIGYKVEL